MGEKGWGEDVSGGRGTGDGGRSRFPVVLSRTSPRGIPWVVSGRDTRAGTRDAVRATRARAWARGDSDAPNPDVGGSRRATREAPKRGEGGGTGEDDEGGGWTHVELLGFLAYAFLEVPLRLEELLLERRLRAREEGVVRIHRRARVAERLGIEFRARAVVVLGAVRAAHGATRAGDRRVPVAGGRRGDAVRRRPVARGGLASEGGRRKSTNGSNFSERATSSSARTTTTTQNGARGYNKFPSRSCRSRARLVARSPVRTARFTRRRLRRARTPVERVFLRAGDHAAQEEEG